MQDAQKAGMIVPDGWAGYARNSHLFLKTFEYQEVARYPDFGSNVELFTNGQFLEVETLGPLAQLRPGESRRHTERWFLFEDVATPTDDSSVQAQVIPKVIAAKEASAESRFSSAELDTDRE